MTFDNLQGFDGAEPLFEGRDLPHQTPSETGSATSVVAVQEPATADPQAERTSGRPRLGAEPPRPGPPAPPQPPMDPAATARLMAKLRTEQRLGPAVAGGLVATVLAAILWGTVTFVTGYQIGWAAVGLGALVGGTVRTLGRGVTKPFGCVGGVLSGAGCLLGNLLCVYAFIAQQEELPLALVFANINPAAIPDLLAITFNPLDLVFYGLAICVGYRFSFRQVTRAEAAQIIADAGARNDGQFPVA